MRGPAAMQQMNDGAAGPLLSNDGEIVQKYVDASRIELDFLGDDLECAPLRGPDHRCKSRFRSVHSVALKFDLDIDQRSLPRTRKSESFAETLPIKPTHDHDWRYRFRKMSTTIVTRFPSIYKGDFNFLSKSFENGVIHPQSSPKFTFDIIIFGAIMYLAFIVPLDIAMDVEKNDKTPLFWISRFLDILFIVDLILNFFTAIDSGNGIELITNKREIAKRYLSSWFIIDFISSVPFDLILFLSSTSVGSDDLVRTTKLLRFSKIIRVLKILRVMRLQRMDLSDGSAGSGFRWQMSMDTGKHAVGFIYLTHWLTCILIIILKETDAEDHAVMLLDGMERYICALYFTTTYLTTVGFGDISASDTPQRIFMIFGLSVGSLVTTYLMSVIISNIATGNQQKTHKRLMMNRIEEYMLYRRFPDDLQRHIRQYIRLMNNNTFSDERAILQRLSPELRKKCTTYNNGDYLLTVPFLIGLSNVPHFNYFIEELALQMRTVYFAADDLIARKNDFDDRCWFIELGSCKIFADKMDEHKTFKVLNAGQYFGESALLADTFVIDYYVRAISWTGMVTVDHKTFNRVMALYPMLRHFLREWLQSNSHFKIAHSKNTYASILSQVPRYRFAGNKEVENSESESGQELQHSAESPMNWKVLNQGKERGNEKEERDSSHSISIGTQTKRELEGSAQKSDDYHMMIG